MTHWKTGKKFFYAGDALVAFEETHKHLVMAGEPLVAAGSDDHEIYNAFREFAKRKGKKICGYYVSKKWNWNRFFKVPLGTSIRIPLVEFDLNAPGSSEIRRALRKGKKLKYKVVPIYQKQRSEEP